MPTMSISWGKGHEQTTLLYNPKTLAYLGALNVTSGERPAIETIVVDRVGAT